jgi:hypothetical protein
MSLSTSIGDTLTNTLAHTGTPRGTSDVVANIRQFFGKRLARRIALHRQLSCDFVETGIRLALPSLLAALANLTARPLGAGILACSVARQYPASLKSIRNGVGSERQDVSAAYGWGYIEYLIGADAFAAMCTGIARVSQLGDEETKLLIGLVGWALLTELRVEQRRLDLSASNLADLLRCGRGGELADARSRSAPVGKLLFVHRRDTSTKPTRTTRRRSGEGDACVVHAFPRRRRTIHTRCLR